MPRWKPTTVTALCLALPLFALSITAPMLWWRSEQLSRTVGKTTQHSPEAARATPAHPPVQPLSIQWEESPAPQPLQPQALAEYVPQSNLVQPRSYVEDEPAVVAQVPGHANLVGPDEYTPPTIAVSIESQAQLPDVVSDDAANGAPVVDVPDLPEASTKKFSRDMAVILPEEMPTATQALPLPVWPVPDALLAQAKHLGEIEPDFATWSDELQLTLAELRQQGALNSPESKEILTHLTKLKDAANKEAATRTGQPTAARVMRVTFALARRLAIWKIAAQWSPPEHPVSFPVAQPADWNETVQAVNAYLSRNQAGQTWTTYLKLAELPKLSQGTQDVTANRALARSILRRMNSTQLDDEQVALLQGAPFDRLQTDLAFFAAEPLNMSGLLEDLEKFESLPLSVTARPIALQYEIARWSADSVERDLAEQLNAHYRNANARVAISADLLNRVLPQMTHTRERVVDNIQGADVAGESHTLTRLRLVLFPDRWRWRMGLEARGEVNTSTSSTKGPATFYQDGYSQFHARKLLTIDRRNISLFTAQADATSSNTLKDYETSYDSIPIFNAIARSVAKQQYDEQSNMARYEVQNKIAGRASNTLDSEVDSRVHQATNQLETNLLAPLRDLDLDPTAIDMQTTESRLIARYRLAGYEQLGSSTPRPQAPGDSMLSVQLHQSAMNNMLQHLHLEGEKKELRSLYEEMAELFNRQKVPIPDDIPDDVYATFADTDAVRVDCERGKVRVTIRLAELSHGKDTHWRNFTVRAYYAPNRDQDAANLVREGTIELIGKNLRIGDQVALRAIFSRVLSRNRTISLINESLAKSKALKDLHVSQFAIQDGWVGIALTAGPQRPILYTRPPAADDDGDEQADNQTEVTQRPKVSDHLQDTR